jgi:hypothetical protein
MQPSPDLENKAASADVDALPAEEKRNDSQVDIDAVDDILDSIGNEEELLSADVEKTESELSKDLGEIDLLLKNLETDDKKE